MKFLSAHGEKLFFVLVLGIGGWSFYGSVTSLQSGTLLPPRAKVLLKNIARDHVRLTPPAPRELTYADRLEGTLRLAGPETGPQFAPWKIWPPPREGGTEYVQGRLGVPGALKAKGGRARATLSWSVPSPLQYVRIVTYEVFKWETGAEPKAEPTFPAEGTTLTDTSLVDEDVEADKTYFYKVRAVGAADPKEDNQFVERPEGTTQIVVDGEKRWVTGFSGEESATAFSNIEFVFIRSHAPWEVLTAVIKIRNWNVEKGDWDVYDTSPGIPKGERIKGYRTVVATKEWFDSGYVFESVGEDTKKIEAGKRWVWKETPEGELIRVEETYYRTVTIHYMMVRKDGTELTRKVVMKSDLKHLDESERGSSTRIRITPRRAEPEKEEETGEVDFEEERRGMIGAGDVKPAAADGTGGGARTPARTPGPTHGMVEYDQNHRTINFKVPANWTEVPGAFSYGDEANKALMEGFVVAYSGSRDDMKMVVQKVFEADGPHGEGTDEVVRGYADALKKRTLAAFPESQLKADTSVMAGQKGRRLAYFTVTTRVGDKDLTVARYCGYATKKKHMITFVCKSEDYEALSGTFLKVVGTFWW